MATAVEHRSQPPLGMGYDPMRYGASPQFTNPWTHSNGSVYHHQQPQHQQPPAHVQQQQQQQQQQHDQPSQQRASPMAYAPQSHPHTQQPPQLDMMQPRPYENTAYVSAPPTQNPYLPTSAPRYSPEQYPTMPYGYEQQQDRRASYQLKPPQGSRDSFSEALDASRGMVAMSQDITPRNVYGPRPGSQDSYGFPTTHSTTSSVSSASGYPYQYGSSYQGSVDGSSVTDYSSASEEMSSRTLPAPAAGGLPAAMGAYPPEQQTMMTQFNSKLAPSAQKKHKCKICDKRFTRPSSLQTHMYSHTGEKPFACDFEGCGRHFSVVSNLRRHKKCHKNAQDNNSVEDD